MGSMHLEGKFIILIQYNFITSIYFDFYRKIDLQLKPNKNLVAPNFKVNQRTSEYGEPEEIQIDGDLDCHYLHKQGGSVAAISMCQDHIIVNN